MSDSDAPALNADGTLKDASEIQWLNSPSDEYRTINTSNPKKRKRSNSSDSDDQLPISVLHGLKGKSPAREVGGKRVKRLSEKGKAAAEELPFKQHLFYQQRFTGTSLLFHNPSTGLSISLKSALREQI
jgi:hypothetical protein